MNTEKRIDLLFMAQQHIMNAADCIKEAFPGSGFPTHSHEHIARQIRDELVHRLQDVSSPENLSTVGIETLIDLLESELALEQRAV